MNNIIRAIFLFTAMSSASYATMSKDQCRNADWNLIGFEDGTKGYAADRIDQHRQVCSKYKVVPDMAAYTTGRNKGLQNYCTPQNGYRVGQSTTDYTDVCPRELDESFRKAFDYGNQILLHQQEIDRYQQDVKKYQQSKRDIEQKISENDALIAKDANGPAVRAHLIDENRELRGYVSEDQDRIDRAQYEIEQIQRLVQELQDNNPYR